MKWFVLLSALMMGSSGLTIRQGEDNVAMESYESRGPRRGRVSNGRDQSRFRQQPSQDSNPAQSEKHTEHAPFFTNIHGDGLGFSSFVQHHGEDSQVVQEGSNMEIKKVVPKSSVTFQMFSEPNTDVKHAEHSLKNKYKSPKHFHESLPGYKKGNAASPFKIITSPATFIPKEISDFNPTPFVNQHKPLVQHTQHSIPSTTPRRPIHSYHTTEKPSYKVKEAASNHHQLHELGATPLHFVESNGITNDGQHSRWKPLGNGVEISSSHHEDYLNKPRKVRKQKEAPSLFKPQPHFSHLQEERFKSERFDHQKALQGSTSFNIGNAMDVGILSTNYNLQSQSSKESSTQQKSPQSAYDFPIITEEEFKKAFGKHPKELKHSTIYLPKKNAKRVPYDNRSQGKRQLRHNENESNQAQSFIHFNGDWTADSSPYKHQHQEKKQVTGTSNYENIALSPSSHPLRPFKSLELTGPQQFSVGASYQIDKGNY